LSNSLQPVLSVGDPVFVDCIDGFGGPARIVETQPSPTNRYKVRMDDGNPAAPFWAHDFEVKPLADQPEYDSRRDTLAHIDRVRELLDSVRGNLWQRGARHDDSKLVDPEKAIFDEYTPKLKGTTYGSDEYKSYLAAMKPALDHHYGANAHHPEHHADGVAGMSLLDLIEMFADWKAATERHADGDLGRSIEVNKGRFGIGDQLAAILANTKREMGW
jgi:hypothetical protein